MVELHIIVLNVKGSDYMSIVVGITGSIACGKSYVSNYLKNKNYLVIDTDKISHEITKVGQAGYIALKASFPEAFNNDILDRKKLGQIIFNDYSLKEKLNNILHPIIYNECKKLINETKNDIIFLDVPLLFEAHFDTLCDFVVCVYTEPKIQLNRLMQRDSLNETDALKRINAQMPLERKKELSDLLLKSEEDFNLTNQNIEKIIKIIKEKTNG